MDIKDEPAGRGTADTKALNQDSACCILGMGRGAAWRIQSGEDVQRREKAPSHCASGASSPQASWGSRLTALNTLLFLLLDFSVATICAGACVRVCVWI